MTQANPAIPMPTQTLDPRRYRASFLRGVRAELRKTTTLRSTWTTFGALFLIGVIIAGFIGRDAGSRELGIQSITVGTTFYMLFTIVIATLSVTGEYASNTMRGTTLAHPRRTHAFLEKLTAVTLVVGIVQMVLMTLMLAVGMAVAGHSWSFSNGGTALLFRCWAIVVLFSLMATGLGYFLRSTAGTITSIFGVLFLSQLIALIPLDFFREVLPKYLPANLINAMVLPAPGELTLGAGSAMLVLLAYVGIACAAGWKRYNQSDV